ncbi:hypothetical protein SAMN06265182_1843 [Persephonella hydrogeniphila]|uniref:Copper resistance protein D n=1 Tax=Persephonella hydrogeniphila TaxID=198703 RepID=A0A285NR79_9AQUI|nr:hypothetical protein [Persephonella hydrogeniphila]SNZ10366.1 hypothetical protein SAMN06265182_1843 [Persephonella hydrogeniphila]
MYEIAKIIHLVSAVIFGGVVFTEVVLLPAIKKEYGEEKFKEIEKVMIRKRGIKIVPIFVLFLYASGFYMFHIYMKEIDLSTNFAKLLILKISLALTVLLLVITAISLFIKGKSESKFFDYAHYGVFVLVFSVIILAKLMFIL